MRTAFAVVLGLAMFSVVNASEPGQPLDCSDWVAVMPGSTCEPFIPVIEYSTQWCRNTHEIHSDNLGRLIRRRAVEVGFARDLCPGWPADDASSRLYRTEIQMFNGTTDQVVGYLHDRCGPNPSDPTLDAIGNREGLLGPFDAANGTLFLCIDQECRRPLGQGCPSAPGASILLRGFASLFEILQTYDPATGGVSFVTPLRPEGLAAADHFDTYYGPLVGPKDFTQAQPLRCNYPATIPQPGDYVEAGIVPDPPSRQGYYYVTAATYQGETRYGRKRENGLLSGRNPAGLPPCAIPPAPIVADLR